MGRVGVATPIPQVEPIPAAQGRLERMMIGPAQFPGIVALARPLLASGALADRAVQNQHLLGDPIGLDPLPRQAHRRRTQRLVVPLPKLAQESGQHTGRLRQPRHPKTPLQGLPTVPPPAQMTEPRPPVKLVSNNASTCSSIPLALGDRSCTGACVNTQCRNPIRSRNFATTEQAPPPAVSGFCLRAICTGPTRSAPAWTLLCFMFLCSFPFELTGAA